MRSRRLTVASRTAVVGTLACGAAATGLPSASATTAPLLTGQLVIVYQTDPMTGSDALGVVNPDGSGMRTITPSGTALGAVQIIDQPQVSPDGKHIAFLDAPSLAQPRAYSLYVAGPDGSNAVAMPLPDPMGTDRVDTSGYQWSPDGAWLYVHDMDPHTGTTYLAKIHPDGTGLARMMPMASAAPFSVATQTGEISYGGLNVYTIYNPATHASRTVPRQWFDFNASLSPDGKYLAILQGGSGHPTQIVVRPTDGSPEWVAQANVPYSPSPIDPLWSPDESQLAFDGATGLTVGSASGNVPATSRIPAWAGASSISALGAPAWIPLPAGTALKPPTANPQPTPTQPPGGTSSPCSTSATPGQQVRIGGTNRIDTAVKVSAAAFGPGSGRQAKVAVLSRSDSYADALAGNALAAQKGGPLLLTNPAGLDPEVRSELAARLPAGSTVYVLGGPNALSPQIEADIRALNLVPKRLQGGNRYDTSVAIANEISAKPHSVLVATGDDYPDALTAGSAAATDAGGGVVILSHGKTASGQAQAYLAGLDPATTNVYGVGGQGVAAADSMPNLHGHFRQMGGLDRYDTDLLVAGNAAFYPTASTSVGVATAVNWPDALAGGAYVGTLHAPLLLADPRGPSSTALNWLCGHGGSLTTIDVFGGTAVISPTVAGAIANGAWGVGHWTASVV